MDSVETTADVRARGRHLVSSSWILLRIENTEHCHRDLQWRVAPSYLKLESPHSRSHQPLQHKELDKQPKDRLCNLVTCMAKKERFLFYDCELWPVTLTCELDLDIAKLHQRGKYLGERSFGSKVRTYALVVQVKQSVRCICVCLSGHTYTETDSHIGPIALPGPRKWSAIKLNRTFL